MESKIPVKKLFRLALFTSTAIGLLTIAPVYLMTFSIAEVLAPDTMTSILKLSPFPPFVILLLATVFITFLMFIFWSLNILLTVTQDKYSINISARSKYIISNVLCISAFILIRLILTLFGSAFYHQILIQKMSYINLFQAHSIEAIRFIMITLFSLSSNSIIIIMQDLLLLREKKAMIESENAQLKIKNIEATYSQLKQQIHPHFLFNSLNTLKTLIRKQPKDAEIYLKKLSDFLRASITLSNENVAKLSDELKFCLDYLELQKGRKYNNYRIIVSNNIQAKDLTEETTGRGLANLSERYKILSGDELVFQSDDKYFSVSLKILDHEDSNH